MWPHALPVSTLFIAPWFVANMITTLGFAFIFVSTLSASLINSRAERRKDNARPDTQQVVNNQGQSAC
jgi:hypothetical protein